MNTRKAQYNEKKCNLIIIGCFLGLLNSILSISFQIERIENNEFYIINNLIAIICIIGIWKMKIWAIFTYISAFAVNQAILLFYDQWFIFQAILPFIVIGIVLKEIEKMN